MSLIQSPSHINIPSSFMNHKNFSKYAKENIDPFKFFEKMSYQSLYDDLITENTCFSQPLKNNKKEFLNDYYPEMPLRKMSSISTATSVGSI